jgi:predicted lipoprotein with Yx(FWY)xxD motif
MKRSLTIMAVAAAVAMGLAACGSSSKNSVSSSAPPTTAAPATTATTGGYSYGGASATPTTAATTSSSDLGVAMNAKVHQNIIVDKAGKTVYIYKPDGTSTTSKVPEALKMLWPEVMSTASTPTVGAGLTASKATVNSAHQVAYNGHLLYTFKPDLKAGDANGQALANVWYVISPSGTPIT